MREIVKRGFDILASMIGLLAFSWLIAICWIIATINCRSNGFFRQYRIGRGGHPFRILKIKTMYDPKEGNRSTVTTSSMPEITCSGRVFRRYKLDELPQLFNVLFGHMSFVGPRPDVASFMNSLTGEDSIILSVRPGITGPASLAFRNEEEILSQVDDPETYYRQVIWPQKVALNREYSRNYNFWNDIMLIFKTIGLSR